MWEKDREAEHQTIMLATTPPLSVSPASSLSAKILCVEFFGYFQCPKSERLGDKFYETPFGGTTKYEYKLDNDNNEQGG